MSKVAYIDPQKGSVHDMFSDLAEDARVESALVIYQTGEGWEITGSLMPAKDLCAISVLVNALAQSALIDD